jgi:hypothetical protein
MPQAGYLIPSHRSLLLPLLISNVEWLIKYSNKVDRPEHHDCSISTGLYSLALIYCPLNGTEMADNSYARVAIKLERLLLNPVRSILLFDQADNKTRFLNRQQTRTREKK